MLLLMYDKVQSKVEDSGVSPVIGVILMVAVTVALVALVTVIVFDIGGDVSESPDATVDISTDGSGTENWVNATVLRNENVDSLKVNVTASGDDAQVELTSAGAGATASLSTDSTKSDAENGKDIASSGTAQVIAVMGDGSEQVLTTTDYDFS